MQEAHAYSEGVISVPKLNLYSHVTSNPKGPSWRLKWKNKNESLYLRHSIVTVLPKNF
jgi:hypothetical protein